ncbi:unnamed protein product [Enterobius vermicularis]|uniref:RUN domain-containing protein n=1 Tax=Enterobius vermicularis TaxID=51028 RepID=A0A0N4VQW5_ENTVE|nr:unnamed protein product [Enterobius vermicularis]
MAQIRGVLWEKAGRGLVEELMFKGRVEVTVALWDFIQNSLTGPSLIDDRINGYLLGEMHCSRNFRLWCRNTVSLSDSQLSC